MASDAAKLAELERRLRALEGVGQRRVTLKAPLDAAYYRITHVPDPVERHHPLTKGTGAPIDASYIVTELNDDLTNEKVLTAGQAIGVTIANGSVTIDASEALAMAWMF